jgi:hypothetical protein
MVDPTPNQQAVSAIDVEMHKEHWLPNQRLYLTPRLGHRGRHRSLL